jgi:DNA-directed RNA polymerase specialized sigma subunit
MTEKQELAEKYINFARKLAWKQIKRNSIKNTDDIISAAYYGLILATKRFEPNLGKDFKSYAAKFIVGQIKNETKFNKSFSQTSNLLDDLPAKDYSSEIEFLSDSEKEIALLYYVSKYTIKEISNIKSQTASKIYRQINSLKRAI